MVEEPEGEKKSFCKTLSPKDHSWRGQFIAFKMYNLS